MPSIWRAGNFIPMSSSATDSGSIDADKAYALAAGASAGKGRHTPQRLIPMTGISGRQMTRVARPGSTWMTVDGVRVLWIRTADVCVGVVPALGGRVLSLVTRAGEHLFRNPDLLDDVVHPTVSSPDPKASKVPLGTGSNWAETRPGPHPKVGPGRRRVAGPPDPVLDGGPYIATWNVDDTVPQWKCAAP